MLKIRMTEEKIVEVYAKDQQMRTPTHLSIGQEAVAAALSLALRHKTRFLRAIGVMRLIWPEAVIFRDFLANLRGEKPGFARDAPGQRI